LLPPARPGGKSNPPAWRRQIAGRKIVLIRQNASVLTPFKSGLVKSGLVGVTDDFEVANPPNTTKPE
jgi:hypothetical protein